MSNRLRDALSPYLQQHADNPVEWWPWCPEAFAEASRRDVPIFLSVGYAACHWCHVMAHESFEDPTLAEVLNEHFVCIKVDREEHPDVDAAYMRATTALTGRGGWPMSVWLDHSGRAFYAGTYFPPSPRMGMPSFRAVLDSVWQAWDSRRDQVDEAAGRIAAALAGAAAPLAAADVNADDDTAVQGALAAATAAATVKLAAEFDRRRGGFGSAPKFPPTMVLEFLIRRYGATGEASALEMVEHTGEAMARGGMYDQLGGGFARYSVDADWVVPHFEKMLYDNAGLLGVYTHWWQTTGQPLARRVAHEVAEFVLRDLRTQSGGFASALDADSVPATGGPPAEGAFYAWSPAELVQVLGEADGHWLAGLCDVTEAGTFEHGRSTLQLRQDPPDPERFARLRARLWEARAHARPSPALDDKVVAAWNGLMIGAMADAGMVFDQPDWVAAAQAAGELLATVHADSEGGLLRVSRDGHAGPARGVLEDYADVAHGFLVLHQATADQVWYDRARRLLQEMVERFSDGRGGLYDYEPDGVLPRATDPSDNAYPAGTSAAAAALMALAASDDDGDARKLATRLLLDALPLMAEHPRFAGNWLSVAQGILSGPAAGFVCFGDVCVVPIPPAGNGQDVGNRP